MRELHRVAMECGDQDERGGQALAEALAYLAERLTRPGCLRDFRAALDVVDPVQRVRAAGRAYNVICDRLPKRV